MRTQRLLLLVMAMLLVSPARAAQPVLRVAGIAITEKDVLDARAQPAVGGTPTILITFSDAIAARIQALRLAAGDQGVKVELDGAPFITLPPSLDGDPTLAIPGGATVWEAEALAKHISGKEPLSDSLEE